jgi:hypothetical protein
MPKFQALVTILVIVGTLIFYQPANAQETPSMPTSGGSLRVLLEPSWQENGRAKFDITFFKPDQEVVQRHVDFGFTITGANGTILGIPALHTVPGYSAVSYNFTQNGAYSLKILVYAIDFIPIETESVEFPVAVTPEKLVVLYPIAIGAIAIPGLFCRIFIKSLKKK